ncbi:helix-turn-helix domain-containing protein [Conexibacter sp. JD483]|uniref:winged helix-turn-helix transcriptional regulator n=1 Tax=unclassified Conexibacter TaxID=2627773 RepID=UPI0027265A7D|nr:MULTISPECIES: helix-turn-helix domain-containing protein [unclassified Conexibacter]MDO8184137.1 helix-turn-helix domain-containing protein [Conexibacter sp. CPCC 205706]MDO8197129.1 helix-turn-helix domain-containing protein [Conexibacter sp. CPCC 205762]MDR9367556.1 helix-turn-helix domain-containing protein [Conexibacter sp. JD483]
MQMSERDFGEKPRRQWAPDARALNVVGDRWLMVIVRDLAAGPLRLDELRRWLPGVSAGALESRLAKLADERLIIRRRFRSLPPRVDLELTELGRSLLPVIGTIARWELRNHWSAPRAGEWIDVAACFRLAPLLGGPRVEDTAISLTVEPTNGGAPQQYVFHSEGGRARVEHQPAPEATTRIAGSEQQWVAALTPGESAAALTIEGDRAAADAFLALFQP